MCTGNILCGRLKIAWCEKYVLSAMVECSGIADSFCAACVAGGMSVSLHVISPESRGLFRRAISQSGTAFSHGFLTTRRRAELELQKALIKLGSALPHCQLQFNLKSPTLSPSVSPGQIGRLHTRPAPPASGPVGNCEKVAQMGTCSSSKAQHTVVICE